MLWFLPTRGQWSAVYLEPHHRAASDSVSLPVNSRGDEPVTLSRRFLLHRSEVNPACPCPCVSGWRPTGATHCAPASPASPASPNRENYLTLTDAADAAPRPPGAGVIWILYINDTFRKSFIFVYPNFLGSVQVQPFSLAQEELFLLRLLHLEA